MPLLTGTAPIPAAPLARLSACIVARLLWEETATNVSHSVSAPPLSPWNTYNCMKAFLISKLMWDGWLPCCPPTQAALTTQGIFPIQYVHYATRLPWKLFN
jgi:hypothetical protein